MHHGQHFAGNKLKARYFSVQFVARNCSHSWQLHELELLANFGSQEAENSHKVNKYLYILGAHYKTLKWYLILSTENSKVAELKNNLRNQLLTCLRYSVYIESFLILAVALVQSRQRCSPIKPLRKEDIFQM